MPAPAHFTFERTAGVLLLVGMIFVFLFALSLHLALSYLFCHNSVFGEDLNEDNDAIEAALFGIVDKSKVSLIRQVVNCQKFTVLRNINDSMMAGVYCCHPSLVLLFVWVPLRAAERLAGERGGG